MKIKLYFLTIVVFGKTKDAFSEDKDTLSERKNLKKKHKRNQISCIDI